MMQIIMDINSLLLNVIINGFVLMKNITKKYCVTNPAEQWEQNHDGERIYNSNAINHLT